MNNQDFISRLNSRSNIYPDGRVLDPKYCFNLQLQSSHAIRYESQISLIVAANLLSRMTPNLAFNIPSVRPHEALPWKQGSLQEILESETCLNRPDRNIRYRSPAVGDYTLNIGPSSDSTNVHGSGWHAFVGPSKSPLPEQDTLNPVGAALASILAVALLFDKRPRPIIRDYTFDAFKWRSGDICFLDYPYPEALSLGELWFVGVGSVGSSALYFLSLASCNFRPTLIDMDTVKVENMDRSPIFRVEQEGFEKVKAAESFLKSIGFKDITAESSGFASSCSRKQRPKGSPDMFISAANEDNVRYTIEQSLPPIQIYATTGNQWQTTLLRHIPAVDSCSCCVFPPSEHMVESMCGGGKIDDRETGETMNAALPFLSFMAGLMAASEVIKACVPGYPFTNNKVTFRASPKKRIPSFVNQKFEKKPGCVCEKRHDDIYREMIAGSEFYHLSEDGFTRGEPA